MKIPPDFNQRMHQAMHLADSIPGQLTSREMKLLFILGALKTCNGSVLEIGSFKGRSTVLLSQTSAISGDETMYAVDPLTLPAITDPQSEGNNTREEFYATINKHKAQVIFNEMFSDALAKSWDKPLRLLWIDGDHTYRGAQSDFLNFSKFLEKGSIIAFHDVLSGHMGPLRVFANDVVLDKRFEACGIVGSIGWAQYIGDADNQNIIRKEQLYIQLISLLPHLIKIHRSKIHKYLYKFKRAFIPHRNISPQKFTSMVRFM